MLFFAFHLARPWFPIVFCYPLFSFPRAFFLPLALDGLPLDRYCFRSIVLLHYCLHPFTDRIGLMLRIPSFPSYTRTSQERDANVNIFLVL